MPTRCVYDGRARESAKYAPKYVARARLFFSQIRCIASAPCEPKRGARTRYYYYFRISRARARFMLMMSKAMIAAYFVAQVHEHIVCFRAATTTAAALQE